MPSEIKHIFANAIAFFHCIIVRLFPTSSSQRASGFHSVPLLWLSLQRSAHLCFVPPPPPPPSPTSLQLSISAALAMHEFPCSPAICLLPRLREHGRNHVHPIGTKHAVFTFWIVCWVTSPLPLGRAEAKATDMVGFFYVPIIYGSQALIILLLSACYCRARILRSARAGEVSHMVRSEPGAQRRPARPGEAHAALRPGPVPAARGGGAAGRICGRGGERPPAAPRLSPPPHMVRPCRRVSCRSRAASPCLRRPPPGAPTA